jgi:arylsulfatase A-like enzyme
MRGNCDCELRYADELIGRLLAVLGREHGEDTIVVITSDHGDEFLEHGGTTHKGTLYEELVRIPLVMRLPGSGPERIDALVRSFDVFPTLLDYCGVGVRPAGLDAVSLRPLLDGRSGTLDLWAYANFPAETSPQRPLPARMVRTDHYKLIVHDGVVGSEPELYDLTADPAELDNIHDSAPEIVGELEARLGEVTAKLAGEGGAGEGATGDGAAAPLDPETEDQLRSLGYLD